MLILQFEKRPLYLRFCFHCHGVFYFSFLSISSFSFFVQNQKIADSKQPKYVTKNCSLYIYIYIFCFFRKLKRSKKKQPTYNSILCSVLPWFLKTTDISHKKQGGEVEENTRERESLRSAFFLVEKFSPVAVSPLTACVLFSWTVHSEYSGLELLRSREGKRDLNLFQSIWLGWKLDCQSNFWRS